MGQNLQLRIFESNRFLTKPLRFFVHLQYSFRRSTFRPVVNALQVQACFDLSVDVERPRHRSPRMNMLKWRLVDPVCGHGVLRSYATRTLLLQADRKGKGRALLEGREWKDGWDPPTISSSPPLFPLIWAPSPVSENGHRTHYSPFLAFIKDRWSRLSGFFNSSDCSNFLPLSRLFMLFCPIEQCTSLQYRRTPLADFPVTLYSYSSIAIYINHLL